MHKIAPRLLVSAGVSAIFVAVSSVAEAGTTNWTTTSSGSWFTAGDWDNGVPNATLDAVVGSGRPVTVDQAGGLANSLSISGATTEVSVTSAGSLSVTNGITIANSSTLTVAGVLSTPTIANNGLLSFGATQTVTSIISGAGSVGASAGTVTFSGANTYTGQTFLDGGATLRAGSATAFGASSLLNFDSSTVSTLDLNGFSQSFGGVSSYVTFPQNQYVNSGLITNSGAQAATITLGSGVLDGTISDGASPVALTKAESGELVLFGTYTYTGATTVTGGTLSLRNVNLSSSSGVTIGSGAVLYGIGTAAAPSVTVQSGGSLYGPGNSSLAINGNLTLASGAIMPVKVSPSSTSPLTVSGLADIDGTLNVTFQAATNYNAKQYDLISSTGILTGTFANATFTGTPTNFFASVTYDAHDVFLDLSGAPGTTNWTGSSGSWFTASNWDSGVPNSTLNAYVGSGRSTVDQAGGIAKSLSITSGSVSVTSTGSLSVTNGITIASGASLSVAGTLSTPTIANSGSLSFSGTQTVASVISGNGSVGATSGIVTFTGANTFTGFISPSSGATLRAGSANTFGANSGLFPAGGTLDLNGFNQTFSRLLGDSGLVTNNGAQAATLTIFDSASTADLYDGNIQDGVSAIGLTKGGAGTETLGGSSYTYTGPTMIDGGTLRLLNANTNISTSSGVTIAAGATLYGSGIAPSTTIQSGGTLLSAGTMTVNDGLTVQSGGTLSSGGTVAVSGNLALASGAIVPIAVNTTTADLVTAGGLAAINGILDVNFANATNYSAKQYTLISSIGALSGTFANVNFTGAPANLFASVTYDAHDVFLDLSSIPGTTNWTATGSGSWFTAANWDSGVPNSTLNAFVGAGRSMVDQAGGAAESLSITGGSVSVTSAGSLSVTNGITIASGASLSVAGALSTPTIADNGSLSFGATQNVTAVVSGTGSVNVSAGTVTLSGANTYTGQTFLSGGGTLRAGSGTAFGASNSLSFGSTPVSTLDLNGFSQSFDSISSASTPGPAGQFINAGSITNNGASAATITLGSGAFDGTISDGTSQVAFTKADPGELALFGTYTYTGATIVGAGTLGLRNVDLSSSSGVTVENGAILYGSGGTVPSVIVQSGGSLYGPGNSNLLTISGNLTLASGAIMPVKLAPTGNGTLTVSGSANIDGTLNVSFLNLTNYSVTQYDLITSTGALSGTFANATFTGTPTNFFASLTYDAHDVFIGLGNAVPAGSVADVEGGVLAINSSQTISGLTSIGTGGTVNLASGSTLTDQQATNSTFSGAITGSGSFAKSGTGTLILNGVSTYSGGTVINGGVLEIGDSAHPGATNAGPVTVNAGGTLSGHGSVNGSVTVAAGGNLQPGGTIGTLTVGSATFAPGSTYTVETNAAGQGDLTVATGAITINSGAALVVTPDPPAAGYGRATTYTILQAAGGITGTFANGTSTTASLLPSVGYAGNAVTLTLIRPDLLATAATTTNQRNVSAAIVAGGLSPLLSTLAPQSDAVVGAGFNQLSGELHASLRSAAIEDSRILRNIILDHLNGESATLAVWGAGFGGYGSIATDANASGLHHDSSGVIAGIDKGAGDGFRLGLAGAYTGNNASTAAKTSSAIGNSGHLIAYGGWSDGRIDLKAGGEFGWGSANVTRTVAAMSQTLTNRQDQRTSQSFAEGGYRFSTDLAMVEPYAGIASISARTGAFAETGGSAALSGGDVTSTQTYSTLGLRAALAPVAELAGIVPHVDLGWQHAFSTLQPGQTLTFQELSQSFTVLGAPLAPDAAAARLGFELAIAAEASLLVDYDGSFTSRVQNNAIRGALAWRF